MSLELRVIERTEGKVIINYEEMKQQLALELQKYKGLVFDESQITEAKKTRANLNKVAKAIDDRRKEEKAIFMKGFEVFENQTKELTRMVKEVSNEIDVQIKDFEEKELNQKKLEINALWESLEYKKVSLEQIYNPKWDNKTYSLKQIEVDMQEKIKTIEDDLEAIAFLLGDKTEAAKTLQSKYLVHLDKGKVIHEYQQEQKAKELLEQTTKPEIEEEVKEEEKTEELYELTFKVVATESEIKALSNFLKSKGIQYEQL